jgi:membrane-bound lytic murein transglycosylase F
MLFGPPYQDSRPVLVYNTDKLAPRDWDDVKGKTIAVAQIDPAQKSLLQALRRLNTNVLWQAFPIANEDTLIEKVAEGETAYAIADATVLSVVRNLYLNVDEAFPVAQTQQFAWAFPMELQELRDQAVTFFAAIKQNGTLQRLHDRYYGHIARIEAVDAGIFQERVHDRLPTLLVHFHHAQEMTGIDWRLLAAIAYAESHWDSLATSPTNVRGVMMLTEDTAQRMQVIDRLDPRQSIIAGAHYFLDVRRTLPARIAEPDRSWIALAAYNIGVAHVEDARVLAQKRKLNPDVWADLKKTLPLLAKPDYAQQVKHGFARGGAPVVFVENIRAYYDILARMEKPYWHLRVAGEAEGGSPAVEMQAQR